MINYDYLRKTLCKNCLLDKNHNLIEQCKFLYLTCELSSSQISKLTGDYITGQTVLRLLKVLKIQLRSPGGLNNPYGRKGKSKNEII